MTDEIKIGSILIDNDPRQEEKPGHPRTVRVSAVSPDYIWGISDPARKVVRISRKRIYTDGKPRKSGFSLKREGGSHA
jgi:hypothetical protein